MSLASKNLAKAKARTPIGGAESQFNDGEQGVGSKINAAADQTGDMNSRYNAKKQKKRKMKNRKRLLSTAVHSLATDDSDSRKSKAAKTQDVDADHSGDGEDDMDKSDPDSDEGNEETSSHTAQTSSAPPQSSSKPSTLTEDSDSKFLSWSPSESFEWLIHPMTTAEFFKDYWEKKPLLIRRKNKKYYRDTFTVDILDNMLRSHNVKFGVNLDTTTYTDGVRETPSESVPGRAHAGTVWSMYNDGCSVRTLNPYAFHPPLHHLVSSLQEYFSCMVGINTYLTPPGTQGFSPHYDDIEAFILQTEGAKRWRLYENPLGEKLPRTSSHNFDQKDLGKPILETVLHAGDMMYFPRGIVHQGNALEKELSHHVTVSTFQMHSWGTFMEKIVQGAMDHAYHADVQFREGLPLNFHDFVGVQHEQKENVSKRKVYLKRVKAMFEKLTEFAPVDAAADQIAADFIHSCLPTRIPPKVRQYNSRYRSVAPTSSTSFEIDGETEVKLLSKDVARLVIEEEFANFYHTLDNPNLFKQEDPQFVSFTLDHAVALEYLLENHAEWKPVCTIPGVEESDQIMIAQCLYDIGILLAKNDTQE
eukprot:m.263210 g.263210  ORF g.263210 m.263210 type:complete len:588 (-) comp49318_c0_seq1:102-1865(-)